MSFFTINERKTRGEKVCKKEEMRLALYLLFIKCSLVSIMH